MNAIARAPTPFGEILRRAVEAVPGAVGGAFAAADGEMVDSYSVWDTDSWAILTAHYGIVLAQMVSAFGVWHVGSPQLFIAQHDQLDVLVAAVDRDYYALLAVGEPRPLALAMAKLTNAASELRKEMA